MTFCIGSDLLLKDRIEVSFVNVQGLARCPVAHTCSCLLEIPKTYKDFQGFRSEFLGVLNSNVWVMFITLFYYLKCINAGAVHIYTGEDF